MSKNVCKEIKFTVEKSLKQNGLSFTYLSGNSVSYSLIKPPTSQYHKFTDYVLLKLPKPAILQKIAFVQHNGEANCNVKSFQLFAGLSEDGCQMLLEGNLKSEFETEEFILRNKIDGVLVPSLYIKICPLQYWESCTKFDVLTSVVLHGIEDESLVARGLNSYQQYQNEMAARLCLKFLRDSGHETAFEVVSRALGTTMEHPVATELYHNLVRLGDYKRVERLLEDALDQGLSDDYMATQPCFSKWKEIQPESSEANWPPSRGGHQVCVDPINQTIYLFGGWDGLCDLADFWKFDLRSELWTQISSDTSKQGGPTPRSCHKMCIDLRKQKLYTVGKYLEHHKRVSENLKSDFYSYDIESNEWTLLSQDTSMDGGPPLVFDHQVVIDDDRDVLFVFGGNTLISSMASEERPSIQSVSTLYAYNITSNTWTHIRRKDHCLSTRIGHSLLYNQHLKYLLIFAGQWNKQNFNDLQVYDTTDLDDVTHLDHLSIRDFLPASLVGYTHRSILETDLNEIHVLTGISKEASSDKHRDVKQNTLWIYDIQRGTWQCIDKEGSNGKRNSFGSPTPAPRFAHQFVYDHVRKIHYLFGGNPNQDCVSEIRLNDLWSLKLARMDRQKLSGDMRYQVRKSCYKELIHLDATKALKYLQNDLYSSIDLSDLERLSEFETLPSLLFKSHLLDTDQPGEPQPAKQNASEEIQAIRTELFEILLKYFPDDARQPSINLVDLVPRKPWDPLCVLGLLAREKK